MTAEEARQKAENGRYISINRIFDMIKSQSESGSLFTYVNKHIKPEDIEELEKRGFTVQNTGFFALLQYKISW